MPPPGPFQKNTACTDPPGLPAGQRGALACTEGTLKAGAATAKVQAVTAAVGGGKVQFAGSVIANTNDKTMAAGGYSAIYPANPAGAVDPVTMVAKPHAEIEIKINLLSFSPDATALLQKYGLLDIATTSLSYTKMHEEKHAEDLESLYRTVLSYLNFKGSFDGQFKDNAAAKAYVISTLDTWIKAQMDLFNRRTNDFHALEVQPQTDKDRNLGSVGAQFDPIQCYRPGAGASTPPTMPPMPAMPPMMP